MDNANPKHVVILGMSRAGTSLLHSLLQNSLQGFSFMDKETSALNLQTIDGNILTKRPLDCLVMDSVLSLQNRNVYILFCIRDPRDVICSVHRSVPHDYFIGYKNQYFVMPDKKISRLANPGLRDILRNYIQYQDRCLTIRYEELVTQPKQVATDISAYIGEQISDSFCTFSETSPIAKGMERALNGQRAIDTKSVGQWKKHPTRIWDEFTQNIEMHEIMKVLGYSDTPKWFFEWYREKLPISIS